MTRSASRLRWLRVVCVLAVLTSCSGWDKAKALYSDLSALVKELQTAYPDEAVTVGQNTNGDLTVTLVNSPTTALPDSVRQARILAIARFAYSKYKRSDEITRVVVELRNESGALGVRLTTTDPTTFTLDEVRDVPVAAPPSSGDTLSTRAASDTSAQGHAAKPKKGRWNQLVH